MEGVEGMLEELGMGELERTEVGRAGTTLEVATTTHGEFRYIICLAPSLLVSFASPSLPFPSTAPFAPWMASRSPCMGFLAPFFFVRVGEVT